MHTVIVPNGFEPLLSVPKTDMIDHYTTELLTDVYNSERTDTIEVRTKPVINICRERLLRFTSDFN